MVRSVYLQLHRQCFCWIDEWIDLNIEEIKKMEKQYFIMNNNFININVNFLFIFFFNIIIDF